MRNQRRGVLTRTLGWVLWISQLICSVALAQDAQPPTTPTNLAVTPSSSTGIVLNWSASTDNVGVTGYQIERCQGIGCSSGFTPFNAASNGWANVGLTPSTTYGYRVRAKDAIPNYSNFTAIVYATTHAATDTQAPTTPSNLSAIAASSTSVVLNWSASTDNVAVTGYQIERCQGSGCNSSFTQFNAASNGWANTTGLTAGTTYGYRVRAYDAVPNYSAFSGIVYVATKAADDTQAPTTPSGLTVTAGPNQLTLAWTAATDNVAVTAYLIERCSGSPCTYVQIASVSGTSYVDTNVVGATSYSYRVRARDAVPNYSTYTSVASALPAACD